MGSQRVGHDWATELNWGYLSLILLRYKKTKGQGGEVASRVPQFISARVEIWNFLSEGCPGGISGKESVCQCRRRKRRGFDPWSGRSPGEGHGHPLQVLLPGESHGLRSLEGYSPWGHRVEHDWSDKAHRILSWKKGKIQIKIDAYFLKNEIKVLALKFKVYSGKLVLWMNLF